MYVRQFCEGYLVPTNPRVIPSPRLIKYFGSICICMRRYTFSMISSHPLHIICYIRIIIVSNRLLLLLHCYFIIFIICSYMIIAWRSRFIARWTDELLQIMNWDQDSLVTLDIFREFVLMTANNGEINIHIWGTPYVHTIVAVLIATGRTRTRDVVPMHQGNQRCNDRTVGAWI